MMLRPGLLHINWLAFDETQFAICQGGANLAGDRRQHFPNVSEILRFGHLRARIRVMIFGHLLQVDEPLYS